MKNENIVRHTLDEILNMHRAGSTGTDWERIDAMTEDEIERLAREENEELGIAHDWYKEAVPEPALFVVMVPDQATDAPKESAPIVTTLRLHALLSFLVEVKIPGMDDMRTIGVAGHGRRLLTSTRSPQ